MFIAQIISNNEHCVKPARVFIAAIMNQLSTDHQQYYIFKFSQTRDKRRKF